MARSSQKRKAKPSIVDSLAMDDFVVSMAKGALPAGSRDRSRDDDDRDDDDYTDTPSRPASPQRKSVKKAKIANSTTEAAQTGGGMGIESSSKSKALAESQNERHDKTNKPGKLPKTTGKKKQVLFKPTAILAVRRANDGTGYQFAVRWEGYDEPTWERLESLRNDRLVLELMLQDAFARDGSQAGGSGGEGKRDPEMEEEPDQSEGGDGEDDSMGMEQGQYHVLGIRLCPPQPDGEDEGVVAKLKSE